MKNILMIAPFFAPYSHAAVYRAYRFAKYLPRFGWKPYILTVDRSFLYFIDHALLDDLPKEAEIIRARHIDLTYSGIKSIFERPATGSRLIKGPTSSDLTAKLKDKKENFLREIIDKIRDEIIFLPDRYITWYPFALKKAKEIINSKHISVIYSSAPPFSPSLIAMRLKTRLNIPWIADFRDLAIEDNRLELWPGGINYKLNCMIERKIIKEADSVLTTCESARNLLLSQFSSIGKDKIVCIKTGTDVEILKSTKPKVKNKKFTIVFAGEYQKTFRGTFFKILNVIFEKKLYERENVEVLIIGSIKRNMFLKKDIESLGLSREVKFVDYLSFEDYFSTLISADATLLQGTHRNQIPIKVADYLYAKKPIITFDANEEMRKILEESGLGIFVPNEVEKGIQIVLNLLKGNYSFDINTDYINRFSAYNQTKEFSDVLDRLSKK